MISNIQEASSLLLGAIEALAERLPEYTIAESREYVEVREPGLALELILTQVYEFDLCLPRDIWLALKRSAFLMSMEIETWGEISIC